MAGLDIKLKPLKGDDNTSLAEMSGAIDGNTVPNFQKTLDDIQQKGVQRLVLDMSKIKYVNSTGLGSLVKYADSFKNSGGGLALIKVPAKVKIVIEMLGLNAFFDICPDLESAKQALGGGDSGGGGGAAPAPAPKADKGPASSGAIPRADKVKSGSGSFSQPEAAPDPFASSPATATAAPAPSGGPVSLPHVTECQSCGVKLEFRKQGKFKCPRCHTLVSLNGGSPVFSKPNKSLPVALSLPARNECGEGLLHLATSVCAVGMQGQALEAVRHAVHEVVHVIQGTIYANNPDGMYHVTIELNGSRVDIRFADHGSSIDPNRAQLYFPRSSQVMDSFECQPHPKGGNIIKMSKQA